MEEVKVFVDEELEQWLPPPPLPWEPVEWEPEALASIESLVSAPNGYSAIVKTYGQPISSGSLSKSWYSANIVSVKLPFAMRIAWNTSQTVKTAAIHKLLADKFVKVLTDVWNYARTEVKKQTPGKDTAFYDNATLAYLKKYNLDLFGGTYNFRMKRGSNQVSMHSFGIAVDMNPSQNGMGTKGNMPSWYVKIWEDNGWTWGGRWSGRNCDPMHFQYAKGA